MVDKLKNSRSKNKSLNGEIKCLNRDFENQSEKLRKALKQLNSYKTRNVNEKLQRRQNKIEALEKALDNQKLEIANLTNDQKERIRVNYLLTKQNSYHKTVGSDRLKKVHELEQENKALQKSQAELNLKLEYLESLVEDNHHEILTREGSKFSMAIEKATMAIMKSGTSCRNVSYVIKTVLKEICGIELSDSDLPKKDYCARLAVKMGILAKLQAAEMLLNSDETSTVVFDGTSRYGEHVLTFNLSTGADQKFTSIGLTDVDKEDSETVFKTFKMLFDDLAVCVANPGDDKDKLDKFNLLVSKIKNTMTDRCAVNKAFIPLLEKLREDILPNILPNFSHLDSETQKNLIQIHDWYCGYHVLLGISDSADSGLKVFESVSKSEDMEPISTLKLKNSETYDFIKSVCDLLQSPGSKTMGRAPLFTAYLNNKGKSNQLIPFYGNRFNLLFKDAAMVLHHYEDIKDFLVNKLDADNLLI